MGEPADRDVGAARLDIHDLTFVPISALKGDNIVHRSPNMGWYEGTSLLLHLRPDLVRTEALADFRGLPHELAARNTWLGAEKPVGIGWLAGDLHPQGVCGNAARADAESADSGTVPRHAT